MLPILALIFCIFFVLWLLTIDHRNSPDNSFVLWVPVIWVLLIASKPLGIWFPSPLSDGEYGSPLDRNFLIVLIITGILILFKRRFSFQKAIKENIWLIFLVVYLLLSTLWSDIGFSTSFTRWVREMPALIMAFILLTENNPQAAMLSVLRRTIYILIPFSLLLIKYYPQYGIEYGRWSGELMWIGVTLQKNGLGRLCLIAIFFLIWSLIKRWRDRSDVLAVKHQTMAEIFLLILSFYLLKGPSIVSMSATAVISLTVGLMAFIVLLAMNRFKVYPGANMLMAIIAAGIILGIVTVFTGAETFGSFTSTVGREATLTGRTQVWKSLLPEVMSNPVLGHGFGGFWTSETRELFQISGGHSGYLDVLLDIGFAGLIFISLFLLSSCRRAQRIMKDDFYWGSLWVCFLLMTVVSNISESGINSLATHLSSTLVFLAVCSSLIASSAENSHAEISHNEHP
jgi:exopolysaccharide production protein ExoQ